MNFISKYVGAYLFQNESLIFLWIALNSLSLHVHKFLLFELRIDRDYNDRQDEIEVMMTSPSSPIAASKSCVDIQSPNSVAVIYTHSVSK